MVTVESSTSRVLGAAVIVYLVPFLLFFAGYFLWCGFPALFGSQCGRRGGRVRTRTPAGRSVGPPGAQAAGHFLLHYRHCAGGLMFGYVRPNRDELKVRELRTTRPSTVDSATHWEGGTAFSPGSF